ncbi:MAG: hypothetical protein HYX51_05640 [Chloroflexi bacterium]|nr:hypothetical protein [Chloroflexota bacterium]
MTGQTPESQPKKQPHPKVVSIDKTLRGDPELQRQLEDAIRHFDEGQPGIPWEQIAGKRGKPVNGPAV